MEAQMLSTAGEDTNTGTAAAVENNETISTAQTISDVINNDEIDKEVADSLGPDTAADGDAIADAAANGDTIANAEAKGDTIADAADNNDQKIDTTDDLSKAVDIGWLKLGEAEFYEGSGGFTGLRYDGKEYKRIQFRRAMPDRYPSEYISVADHENKEIGMIKSLTDLTDGQLGIVSGELDRRYYCPEILEIKSVRDKLGYVYMEMDVMAGGKRHERSAAVNDVNKNIRMIGTNRLIFDVDGNRFLVNSLDKLDAKSLRRLEPYMF